MPDVDLFGHIPEPPGNGTESAHIRATRKLADWRASLTRAWGYWRGRAQSEQEGARIDAVFENMLAEGPDFLRCHGNAEFRDAPKVHLDRNDIAKLMTACRAIERGSWKERELGQHGGTIGRMAMRVLEAFLFVIYRPGRAICLPYEGLANAAMVSRRTVADALKHLAQLGLITVIPRRKRIKTELGFKVVQDVNAYALHPPRGLGVLAIAVFCRAKDQSAKAALLKGQEISLTMLGKTLRPPPDADSGGKARP
jgi:hypothetical protein